MRRALPRALMLQTAGTSIGTRRVRAGDVTFERDPQRGTEGGNEHGYGCGRVSLEPEEFRRKSLGAISTMSTLNYILSITVYILARDVKSTPTYGAYMWRRPRSSRVG